MPLVAVTMEEGGESSSDDIAKSGVTMLEAWKVKKVLTSVTVDGSRGDGLGGGCTTRSEDNSG